jgi:uncharacterized radical SAM superfamily Fe-S cluster-containing enzyme
MAESRSCLGEGDHEDERCSVVRLRPRAVRQLPVWNTRENVFVVGLLPVPEVFPVTVAFDQPVETSSHQIEFLWLELTNRCNLRCVHCYADSGPHGYKLDRLVADDYRRLIDEARELGCDQVQFIGGEPTLDKPRLVVTCIRSAAAQSRICSDRSGEGPPATSLAS